MVEQVRNAPRFCAVLWLCMLAACDGPSQPAGVDAGADAAAGGMALELPALCARAGADAVRDVFCAASRPELGSLSELQAVLEIRPGGLSAPDIAKFVVLGHSTALSGHLVSPLNPRAILIGEQTIATFQRGVQRVELLSSDRESGQLNFYLITFEQACNRGEGGCTPGDLYTPRVEQAWTAVRIEDDEDLKNTPSDCRQCHQRGLAQPKLLMRELESPWTHFLFPPGFISDLPGVTGSDLTTDYFAAKSSELYAGASLAELNPNTVFQLELLVGEPQPLLFDAPAIHSERYPYSPDGFPDEALPSPTWEAGYEAFKRGEQLAQPYLEARVTDPDKQAALTAAYQRYLAGELAAEELPELGDIFPDDPSVRARIGLQTDPAATAPQALIQACGSCHNDVLDQSLSRARFNIDLSRLDRAELDLAIARLELAPDAPGAMPPPEARQLDAPARRLLIDYLRNDTHRTQPDPTLQHAAHHGMSGGAGPKPDLGGQ